MIKKINLLLMIIIVTATFTGCWDAEDVNKKSFILSAGVDKVDNNVEITGESTDFVAITGEKGTQSQQQSLFQYSGIGKDAESARSNIEQEVTRSFFLGEVRVTVFGTAFAKEGILSYLNRIDNTYDYRKTLIIVVSREPAKEILNYPAKRNLSTGFFIEDSIKILTKNSTAIYTNTRDMLFFRNNEGVGFFIPYVGIEKGSIRYLGLGVIKDFKLIDIVKFEDTNGILYLLNEKPVLTQAIYLKDDKKKYIFKVAVKKRNIITDYRDEKVIININLDINASLQYQYKIDPISKQINKELENKISEKVKKDIVDIINKSQYDYGCDTFGFIKLFRAQNPKIYKKINWKDKYNSAEVNINVKTKIIDTNLKDTNANSK
ncbi:Ger(x)C family spore germination protein [Clostridium sp. FP2]|uniref:Ger(x)C family spore germination protein n=1 Tax=Clostridium sp. FP2 TaxID=2724481 RepID=UPI0013E8FAB3|nr:Ger(x)C family spore germination protein [Clostridium sp. FP2]MBZ9623406.1 Ger(x)C family spore germination protein [Clostridium sp. FP2]